MQRSNAFRLFWVILAGGFLVTLIEVRYEHREAMREYIAAVAPIVVTPLLALAALVPLAMPKARRAAQAVLALGVLVGVAGVGFHTDWSPTRALPLFTAEVVHAYADDGEERSGRQEESDGEGEEEEAPILAPLGIAGLAALGLVALAFAGDDGKTPPPAAS